MTDYAIQTENLTKKFGGLVAVDGLSLNVKKGEIFGLLGPDGAGKTTVTRMLTTIIAPSNGSGSVAGFDISADAEEVRRRIGYVAQSFNLYPDLTVSENMDFYAQIFGISKQAYAERKKELLHFSRLTDFLDRRAGKLSGGMQKKLAVSCALIHEPEVLFLDEPTSGVDPLSRLELWEILLALYERGVTLFATTTYLDEAKHFTRIAFLDKGKKIVEDEPEAIRQRYAAAGEQATLENAWMKIAAASDWESDAS
jgi:ABC-2 type transport system ATP-binding protein